VEVGGRQGRTDVTEPGRDDTMRTGRGHAYINRWVDTLTVSGYAIC